MASDSIFHDGDVQSGIAKAIQESKAVVIFLRDESTKSEVWDSYLFVRKDVSDILVPNAVVLRMARTSQEEAFLAAFCRVQEYPSLIVIKDGKLQAQLGPSLSIDRVAEELEALFGSFKSQNAAPASPATESTHTPSQPQLTTQSPQPAVTPDPTPAQSAATHPPVTTSRTPSHPPPNARQQPTPPPPTSSTPATQSKSESKGKGKARAASPQPGHEHLPSSAPRPKTSSQLDWIEKQRQRQLDAKLERERIMASIEADKAERRAEAEQRRLERQAESSVPISAQHDVGDSTSVSRGGASAGKKGKTRFAEARISVRLLSGHTLRYALPAAATLEADLRPLVEDEAKELKGQAYTFKLLQAPLPARAIEVGEERQTLEELGLTPSAMLVVVMVGGRGVSEAYAGSGVQSLVGGLWNLPWDLAGAVGNVVGGLTGAVGGMLGYGGAGTAYGNGYARMAESAAPTTEGNDESTSSAAREHQRKTGGGGIRIRTLADQRVEAEGKRDQSNRWYNGNQLSFQGRDDDDQGEEGN